MHRITALASAAALLSAPALAHEGMDMPGMTKEAPVKAATDKPEKPTINKKATAKAKAAPVAAPAVTAPGTPPPETDREAIDHGDHADIVEPEENSTSAPKSPDSASTADGAVLSADEWNLHPQELSGEPLAVMPRMSGLFGNYSMTRDASGTSWQPAAASHGGLHFMSGDWMFMGHLDLTGVYATQSGPRGDDKTFAAGMIMGSARRDFVDGGVLNLRAMISPDPFMGKSGYPLLLAAGETADGATLLRDRQHPHDLFMELSASYAHPITQSDSLFIYAGLPGEPAFGPPAFMHRPTGAENPEAPISHHWLDSTHITFGVLTFGWVHDDWKVEVSSFRGREPDERRYDIESPRLDSESVRVSWNPTERLALQASWADLKSPEALHADEDEVRWSASAIYVLPLGNDSSWSATAAFGRKEHGDETLDAWLFETAWKPNDKWTVFGRAETLQNSELAIAPPSHDIEQVSRLSIGAVRDFEIRSHVKFGVGGLVNRSFVSDALAPSYDGDRNGATVFVRLKIS